MFNEYGDMLTVEDLMEALGIGKNAAYDLLRNGELKCFLPFKRPLEDSQRISNRICTFKSIFKINKGSISMCCLKFTACFIKFSIL